MYDLEFIFFYMHRSMIFWHRSLRHHTEAKHGKALKITFQRSLNPFVPNAPFLYPLKKSENRMIFWCFQGAEEGCIKNKRVNLFQADLPLYSNTFFFFFNIAVLKYLLQITGKHWNTLCEKCSYFEFSWSVFSRIQSEYGKTRTIQSMWENMDRKNSECEHFSRSDKWEHWHEMG